MNCLLTTEFGEPIAIIDCTVGTLTPTRIAAALLEIPIKHITINGYAFLDADDLYKCENTLEVKVVSHTDTIHNYRLTKLPNY